MLLLGINSFYAESVKSSGVLDSMFISSYVIILLAFNYFPEIFNWESSYYSLFELFSKNFIEECF